ncbi:MAG: hypothetical protein J2P25_00735 [Nocardiopsaceae bacterium]|nr:hypothetical protein [Nocardiopsaceae bacterium]
MEQLSSADPRKLGGIAIVGRLGQGAMGTVYFGVTPDGEQVVVKTVPPLDGYTPLSHKANRESEYRQAHAAFTGRLNRGKNSNRA